jgi:hypothetical protein
MVLISDRDRLLNRLSSCLKRDKKDSTHLHVEVDSIITYLAEFGIYVPPTQYEALVSKMLTEQLVDTPLGQTDLMRNISIALVDLAATLILAAEASPIEDMPEDPDKEKKDASE